MARRCTDDKVHSRKKLKPTNVLAPENSEEDSNDEDELLIYFIIIMLHLGLYILSQFGRSLKAGIKEYKLQ